MFEHGLYSDKGKKSSNQDSCYVAQVGDFQIALVADGVSSCRYPKQASELAVNTFYREFSQLLEQPLQQDMMTLLSQVMHEVNSALYFAASHDRTPSMLSTFSALIVSNTRAYLVHVGDSCIYRQFDNNLERLTRSDQHKDGSLSKALGYETHVSVQYKERALLPGEYYLLATDGVYDFISLEEIKLLLTDKDKSLTEKANNICQSALREGSRDNLSCICLHIDDTQHSLSNNYLDSRKKRFAPVLKAQDRIDDYQIIELLHNSTRSAVYLAKHISTDDLRVLKMPSEYLNDDRSYITRFLKEEKIALGFDHKSIIKFYPRVLDSKYLYHVMEYVPGQTLDKYIQHHAPLPLHAVHSLLEKIVLSLRVLHRVNLLHQDLKPDNLIITEDGDIKIIDLGSVGSLILQNEKQSPVGALEYCAPEYFNGGKLGIYSDLFSLAVITYELLTGQKPFNANQIRSSKKILSFEAPSQRQKSLPSYLSFVFERAFSVDPNTRYQALSEFLYDLDEQSHHNTESVPLIKRAPLQLWKTATLCMLLLNIILLYILWGQ